MHLGIGVGGQRHSLIQNLAKIKHSFFSKNTKAMSITLVFETNQHLLFC
jgi:hypothetical protein